MTRYQVIDNSGKSHGTFPTKPLAYQFINNTYPSYKNTLKSDGYLRESTIAQVLPDIMAVVPVNLPKAKPKSDFEKLIELAESDSSDTAEVNRLIKRFEKGKNAGQPVYCKLPNGTVLSFPTFTDAGDYFGATGSAVSNRIYQGTISTKGKLKGILFYIEEESQ